jgi:hypothetical protein
MSMIAAMGIPKLEAGPQKSVIYSKEPVSISTFLYHQTGVINNANRYSPKRRCAR